jgi:hypothetical protein
LAHDQLVQRVGFLHREGGADLDACSQQAQAEATLVRAGRPAGRQKTAGTTARSKRMCTATSQQRHIVLGSGCRPRQIPAFTPPYSPNSRLEAAIQAAGSFSSSPFLTSFEVRRLGDMTGLQTTSRDLKRWMKNAELCLSRSNPA